MTYMHQYQDEILRQYWPEILPTPETRDTLELISAKKEYGRPKTLFHYTSIDSAIEILEGEVLADLLSLILSI